MPCNLGNPWPKSTPPVNLLLATDVSAQCLTTCIDPGNTDFFYSNYPERLLSQFLSNGALWSDGRTLSPQQTTITYRCYLWHVNSDTEPLYAGLTLHNPNNSMIVATNGMGVMFTDEGVGPNAPAGFPAPFAWFGQITDGGRCIAQSQLARTLDSVPSLFTFVQPGATAPVLQWGPLSPGKSYGVYLEFQVSGQAGYSWTLREVYGRSLSDLVAVTARQIPLADLSGVGAGGDGRGNWPTNMVSIQAPVLEISGTDASKTQRVHCAAGYNTVPDNCWPPYGEAKGNSGKYGVVYADQGSYPKITLPFRIQPNTRAGTVEAWLTGGAFDGTHYFDFFGSASSQNAGGIPFPALNVNRSEAVLLYSKDYVPIPTLVNDAAIVGVAVAGGATTPFDVVLRWV